MPIEPEVYSILAGHGSERALLVETLRQMEGLGVQAYKTMCRRLYLQWHPDKSAQPFAAEFFRTIRRHSEAFEGNRDFAFLEDFAREGITVDADVNIDSDEDEQHNSASGVGPRTHSWFDEFREEQQRKPSDVQSAPPVRARVLPSASVGSGQGLDSRRRLDTAEADLFWRQAARAQSSSAVLLDHDDFGYSVWLSHQATEFIIKSLMLRTCGITELEMKGKGGHNLVKHVSRIVEEGHDWPVPRIQLQTLSNAYFTARYPGSNGLLPADLFTRTDAVEAQETARALKAWAIVCGALPVPPAEVEVEALAAEPAAPDPVSFEPAPLPPAETPTPAPALADRMPAALASTPAIAPTPTWEPLQDEERGNKRRRLAE
jgi:HEPN domain-containing protein